MRIMTCNIRCPWTDDGPNNWDHRKGLCCDVIASREADVVCLQEAFREQLLDVLAAMDAYDWFGICDRPDGPHPLNAILYRREAFERISAGGYWLSQTPHVPGSLSWDSACIRVANWVRLADRASGRELRIVNTHLDHVSQVARENQARLLNEDAAAYPADYPQILTGDMNATGDNPAVASLLTGGWCDTYRAANGDESPGVTFHEFLGERCAVDYGKIDWIVTRGGMRATAAEIVRDSRDGRFPSDHYFVSADVEFTGQPTGA